MIKQWPRSVMLGAHLMNALRDGPVRQDWFAEDAHRAEGFSQREIESAAGHFGVTAHELDGAFYWMRPANLFAIWWGNRRSADYCQRQRRQEGGSAA